MKLGIVLPIWRLTVQDALRLTEKAEVTGWDTVLIPDHVVAMPATMEHYGPNWPDPCSLLSFLAGRTTRVELGTSVIVLPYRHPLADAKAMATVDQVSNGRFICGLGIGWDEQEFQALGVPFAERGPMADEYIRLLKTVWTAETASFDGKYYHFENAGFAPRPIQQPHPPIWIGGSPELVSRPSIRRTIAVGDAWHPVFLSRDNLRTGVTLLREMAQEAGRDPAPRFCPRNLLNLTAGPKGDGRAIFEGSPDEVAADVRYLQDLGTDYITFDLFACADVDGMDRMIEQFAQEVRPAIAAT